MVLIVVSFVIFAEQTISNNDMNKDSLETLYTLLSIGGLVCGGCIGFWKLYGKKAIQKIKKQEEVLEKVSDMLPLIAVMSNEFKPNGGSSFKDGLIRIEKSVGELRFTIRDITENQKAFFDVMEVPYWISNDRGECVFASRALCETMGRTSDEICGNNWASWLHPTCNDLFDKWNKSVTNRMLFDEDYILRRNDGTWQKVNGYATHKMVDGKYVGSIGRLSKIGEPYSGKDLPINK